MQLEIHQPVTGNDLARLLEGDQGTFLAQNNGQSYVVTAAAGHSIKSLRPIGAIVNDPEKWQVTKISSMDVASDSADTERQQQPSRSGAQR